jgi:hypothetical protein
MSKTVSFSTTILESLGMSGHHFIEVPIEIANEFTEKSKVRVICNINDVFEFQCALMPQKGYFYIGMGKSIMKKAGVAKGEKIQVILQKDESEYGLLMPEVLQEILEQDEEANKAFHALTSGRQRSIIHLVSKAKRLDTQIKRAVIITENIKLGVTDVKDFLKR